MPRVQFIGQISLSFGNTLPELCSKLKNFGTGRMFVRTALDQNKEVSYVVLTRSQPMVTHPPPKVIIGKLDEIAALTRKAPDTQSEFFGRVVERGILLNGGREMKIASAINPDWRLIRKEEEEYFRRNTMKTQEQTDKTLDQSSANLLQEHISDIIKYWMAKRFFEGAQHAAQYALTRPTYPPELMQKIIAFVGMKYQGVYDNAADIGCGSGQSTELLAPYFQKVYGYDVSKNQIKEATMKNKIPNIKYKASPETSIPHENESLCLITAAQAAHWFDLKQFYTEVHRTLKPKGVLAIYGYGLVSATGEHSTQLNSIIQDYYKRLLPYFPPDRLQIDNKYGDIILPFEEKTRDESVRIKYQWDLDRFLAYVSTWSGYIHYMQKYPDKDILLDFHRDLSKVMNKEPMNLYFNTFILLDMLTYESITIGQRVEVLQNDRILYGTVLYKGPIIGQRGVWLGIDLTTPDGDNDGSLKGRVYFRAPLHFGIFTTIDNIRLASNFQRKRRSVYRTVNKKSIVEEELFGNTEPLTLPPTSSNASISTSKVSLSLKNPHERPNSSVFSENDRRYPIPNTLAARYDERMRKQRETRNLLASQMVDTTEHTFAPAPSIPRVFMPPSEVDRAKRSGFVGMSIPRYTVVHDQHDFLE